MKADDALPHEIALALEQTPGYLQIGDLHDHEVVHHPTTAGAHEHPPSSREPTVRPHTVVVERHLLEDSLLEEMNEIDRRLLRHGGPGLLTVMGNRAMRHAVGPARAVPATFLQGIKKFDQPGEVLPPFPIARGMVVYCLQEHLHPFPFPRPYPPPQPTSIRPQSPSQPYRREQRTDMNSGRPSSRSRQASPNHPLASESNTTSRRSSPFNHAERGGLPPLQSRSRSPARHSPLYRSSGAGPPGRSPRLDQAQETPVVNHAKGPDSVERLPRKESSDQGPQGVPRLNRNIPTQPRNLVLNQTPPLGPSRGPPPHNRGPHNAPTLAAPTRPRHASGSRDGPWMGSPSMGPRRPSSIMPSHGAPSGPRASFSSPVPGGPGYRGHPGSRQGSSVGTLSPLTPKPPNYLAGLGSIVPGGRALPSALDVTTERRLAQLDADKEKLLEQMAATQKPRRAGLRDWDRLDRESSICALKSELAEGHLQRMADESIGGGVLY
ncbi:hypothetical protein N7533_001850 [Penicillium manginii]|uniref:uncharacterized protein n=1 Tax=Penicillium manginii TaxID=203109 RepID=UPI0025476A90|nr:uncharacterized protein N7533_001850 [Penicillium manginii]KAJ5763169.1 hypothetical protein N7533_001850 [Penicillium manginii]